MSSAKKYAVADQSQPKRRVKRCPPISLCELMYCDWDYEVDADDDDYDDAKIQVREAFMDANGDGYSEPDTSQVADPAGAATPPCEERKVEARKGSYGRKEEEDEKEEDEDEDESLRMGVSFSQLRGSLATKHNSPLRKMRADDENLKLTTDQSGRSVLDSHHGGEEGEEEEGGEAGREEGVFGDWRERKRSPWITVPHSPPGTSPARVEDRDRSQPEREPEREPKPERKLEPEPELEPERAGAAPLPGAVTEAYDESSTARRREEENEANAEEEMAPSIPLAAAVVNKLCVEERRSELYLSPTPAYRSRATANRVAGLTPTKALEQLLGNGAGDVNSHSYREVRGRLGVEEELEKTLDEVLAPVDELSSFLSRRHNLFTPYMDMPKSLLLPYSNYEAYGQPRTFSTAALGVAAARAGVGGRGEGGGGTAVQQVGNAGGGNLGATAPTSAAGGGGMALLSTTSGGYPSWMGPR